MFKNILIPISSEFYQKETLQKGAFLAKKLESKIRLIYIIEEKTLDQTEKRLNSFRTDFDKGETRKEIIKKHLHTADNIVFDDAKLIFENIPFDGEVIEGEFSAVIKGQIKKYQIDLILMGFEKDSVLHYRLFGNVDIPIWVESGSDKKKILAVCSNLAPNKKVPEASLQLSKILDWDLYMIYVIDVQDAIEVDSRGMRSEKKSENELLFKANQFIFEMENKGINVKIIKGSLEKEATKIADKVGAGLVMIGREKKKKGFLGLAGKSLKRKMAEQRRYSILFIN
jgi:nucleotide-binding universal stress UspA family protein